MKIQLVVAQAFSQGVGEANSFTPGKVVPDETWANWADDTLANRLQNGYVKWEPAPEPGAESAPDPLTFTKEQLAQYLLDTFQVTVDKRMNLQNMQQQLQQLQERARLVAATNASAAAAKAAQSPPADPPAGDTGTDPNAGASTTAP